MQFLTYIKEKTVLLIVALFWLGTINMFLMTIYKTFWLGAYIDVTACGLLLLAGGIDYYKRKTYFADLENLLEQLDKKYLVSEMMPKGQNQEQKKFYQIAKDMGKSMAEHVNSYKYANMEYKEYIEMWIHEVKIPIATGKLVLANHKNEFAASIEEEFQKIEDFTEQALFYARSNYVEKDYLISNVNLQEVVHQVLVHQKRNLILNHVTVNLHDLDNTVLSDGKWLGFIIGQLVANSLKYCKNKHLSLDIYSVNTGDLLELHIKDNGIGILSSELPMVFEKGFTGTNGRKNQKSTGIGLYLCKKLCQRLKHSIAVKSDGIQGCEVVIGFSKTSFYDTLS
ncbi:sensor histidine kinase [[Clostridium] polysaccharolyticum]|uniref:histidine kinase n=1 Tax=[Clostridium] polysaccharolyticum TaxID=29364 RepID=A0A1I0BBB2_9FIRM|nr:sensor histidine kinase [[Clostridium] polysaccharolyticum]SET03742.1 Signal transduction histidine kinase [[Clostridium] polysaccharolyticum]